jgi:hypothetical protein
MNQVDFALALGNPPAPRANAKNRGAWTNVDTGKLNGKIRRLAGPASCPYNYSFAVQRSRRENRISRQIDRDCRRVPSVRQVLVDAAQFE